MVGSDAGFPDKSKNHQNSTSEFELPQFPGEDFLAHAAAQWKEQAEARLAKRHLLTVAHGQEPASAKCIIDVDLTALPMLPVGHREYHRRMETRIKTETQNTANAEKRYTITMEAWTELYTALKTCTEVTAPVLSRSLMELCDLFKTRNLPGGYFDGPRAWRIVVNHLEGDKRTEMDKNFYRTAERLQRASHLPDGCTAAEYAKKALAFLVHIKPYLPQLYDDDDTTTYLIQLMPKALREGGRRIRHELELVGKLHDFMYVIQKCRALVHEEQKASTQTHAFVITDDSCDAHDVDALMRTTGMMLAVPAGTNVGALGGSIGSPLDPAAAATEKKWCDNCPHKGQCFQDPAWAGPPPLVTFVNKEKWRGILDGKAANAKKHGVPNARVTLPSKEAVDKFLKARKEKREKNKAARGEGGGGEGAPRALLPPQGLAADAELADWRTSLLDLTECVAVDPADILWHSQDTQMGCACTVCPDGAAMADGLAALGDANLDIVAVAAESSTEAPDGEAGDAELDGIDQDEDEAGDDLPQFWFVFTSITGEHPPQLVYCTDPDHLSVDESLYTPVAFGADEDAARRFHDQGGRPPAPTASFVSPAPPGSRQDKEPPALAEHATKSMSRTAPGHAQPGNAMPPASAIPSGGSTNAAARAAIIGDPLGPTALPTGRVVAAGTSGAATTPEPAPRSPAGGPRPTRLRPRRSQREDLLRFLTRRRTARWFTCARMSQPRKVKKCTRHRNKWLSRVRRRRHGRRRPNNLRPQCPRSRLATRRVCGAWAWPAPSWRWSATSH